MNPNQKAQRLMLLTDIKFQLDNKSGELVWSETPIADELIKQAMSMPDDEFEKRLELQRRNNIVKQLNNDYAMKASYSAYSKANGDLNLDQFIRLQVDLVEDEKLKARDNSNVL